jgi:hypothetical protein
LRLLPSHARPTAGAVLFEGRDVLTMREPELRTIRGAGIAMISQDPATSLNPVMKIGAQISEVLRAHLQLKKQKRITRVLDLFREVGFEGPERIRSAYTHVNTWPGDTPAEQWLTFYQAPSVISFGGFRTKVKSVRMLVEDKPLTLAQDDLCLRITGLPASAPDEPATVIVIDCEGPPIKDRDYVRKNRRRFKVGVS